MGRLFLRIFLWFWLSTTCLFLVLTIGFMVFQPDGTTHWRAVRQEAVRSIGSLAVNAYEREGHARASSVLAEIVRDTDFHAWLFAQDGSLVGGASSDPRARAMVDKALAGQEAQSWTGEGVVLVADRIQSASHKDYVVVWEQPLRFGRLNFRLLTLRMLSLLVTGGIVCLWLTWYFTRPVRALRAATYQFSLGDLAVRVGDRKELRRGDEISELARDFDNMAARIEELLKSQQQLLADISHELRSPLARVSLALDLARRRLGDSVPEHQRIEREVRRLDDLIGQLLTLAQLHGRADQTRTEAINLRKLVHEVADDARFEAEATGRRVVVASDCEVTTRGSRALLRSAIENVVRNAVRHTSENSEVQINMQRPDENGRLVIAVQDSGPGVPPHTLDRLFDPFFRVEESRGRESGGVGLGLAIVRQAMLFHGGNATAQNHPKGGLLVQLELPVR